jgi:hypothetical protein
MLVVSILATNSCTCCRGHVRTYATIANGLSCERQVGIMTHQLTPLPKRRIRPSPFVGVVRTPHPQIPRIGLEHLAAVPHQRLSIPTEIPPHRRRRAKPSIQCRPDPVRRQRIIGRRRITNGHPAVPGNAVQHAASRRNHARWSDESKHVPLYPFPRRPALGQKPPPAVRRPRQPSSRQVRIREERGRQSSVRHRCRIPPAIPRGFDQCHALALQLAIRLEQRRRCNQPIDPPPPHSLPSRKRRRPSARINRKRGGDPAPSLRPLE